MKKKILWVLLGFLAIVLYYNSSFHIKSHLWMYRDEKIRCIGIGEFVDFSSSRGTYIYSCLTSTRKTNMVTIKRWE